MTRLHSWLRLALCLAILLTAVSLVNSQAILIDDFSDGDDEGWTRFDNTQGQPGGPGIFDASDQEYQLETEGAIPQPPGGLLISTLDDSENAAFSSGYLRATLRVESYGTNPFLLMRGQDPSLGAYTDYYAFGGGIVNGKFFIDNSGEAVYVDSGTGSLQAGEEWVVEAGVVQEFENSVRLSLRVWRLGDPEPDDPQLELTDATPLSHAPFGVGVWVPAVPSTASAVFDDIYFTPEYPGDYDGDTILTADDIDLLSAELSSADTHFWYDLTGDRQITDEDHRAWVKDIKYTWYGDADLNGEFNTSDLVLVLGAGKYETMEEAGWEDGDWNGDGVFGTGDLVKALEDGGYEMGPRVGVQAVPEPGAALLVILGVAFLFCQRRRS